MGVRQQRRTELLRVTAKTLDHQFTTAIQEGLNCSPFEAEAVVQVVHEVYFPFLDEAAGHAPPGRVTLVAVSADEPGGKPIAQCATRTVCLTYHRGAEDDLLLRTQGPTAFRRSRIPALLQEALSQGALLTREDLAYHVFGVGTRTISRDLAALRAVAPAVPLPLRGTVHDLGPVLTHRLEIIRLALAGATTSEICQRTHHSPSAVSTYLTTFIRCAQLADRGLPLRQIAFLLHRGPTLIQAYLDLVTVARQDPTHAAQLTALTEIGRAPGKKGATPARRSR